MFPNQEIYRLYLVLKNHATFSPYNFECVDTKLSLNTAFAMISKLLHHFCPIKLTYFIWSSCLSMYKQDFIMFYKLLVCWSSLTNRYQYPFVYHADFSSIKSPFKFLLFHKEIFLLPKLLLFSFCKFLDFSLIKYILSIEDLTNNT